MGEVVNFKGVKRDKVVASNNVLDDLALTCGCGCSSLNVTAAYNIFCVDCGARLVLPEVEFLD